MTKPKLQIDRSRVSEAVMAQQTKIALKKHVAKFNIWLANLGLPADKLTTAVFESYFMDQAAAGLKRSTIDQAKWALESHLTANNLANPMAGNEFRQFLKGLHRIIGFKQNQKKELTIEHIMLMKFPNNLIGLRDQALLLVGFSAGLRRSELIGLDVANLNFTSQGLTIQIKRSKTNQYAQNEEVSIPFALKAEFCPVQKLKQWLAEAKIVDGAVFRSFYRNQIVSPRQLTSHHIAIITKKYMAQLNFNPADYSGHSLRAGCATYLLQRNVSLNIVAKQLRHKRVDTTLKYDRNQVNSALKGLY